MIRICIPCGYIYDGEQPFQSLPEHWGCPDCGTAIDNFGKIDESEFKKPDQQTTLTD